MLFNSIEFLFFLLALLIVFTFSPKQYRKYILLVASLYFYGSWNAAYLLLIVFIILSSFISGLIIGSNSDTNKKVLIISVTSSLSVLFLFKYGNFIINNFNLLVDLFIDDFQFNNLSFLLPVGISFYTFQAIGYVVDVYKKNISHETNIVDYSLYIAFFPQLVAGPIERAKNILPQVKSELYPLPENINPALSLILSGFFKKVVIADRLCMTVDKVYANPQGATAYQVLLAVYFFSFQIYCDFSGYTDIARGVAKLFNINLMENFNKPYFATSVRDFWRRWHISLSTWFRDYLYIPLGGSRKGLFITSINILIVFTLCGLWHGSAYTFVAWGLIHGVLLTIQSCYDSLLAQKKFFKRVPVIKPVKVIITFHVITLLWVFFRSNSFNDSIIVFSKLYDVSNFLSIVEIIVTDYENLLGVIFILLLIGFEVLMSVDLIRRVFLTRVVFNTLFQLICFYLVLMFGVFDLNTFIYFQF